MTILGSSMSSKGSHCALCHYHLWDSISSHHSCHSGTLFQDYGVIFSIVQLNISLPLPAIIDTVTGCTCSPRGKAGSFCCRGLVITFIWVPIKTSGVLPLMVLLDQGGMISVCAALTCSFSSKRSSIPWFK